MEERALMSTVEKLENNKVKMEIRVAADKFEEGMQKAYIKTGKRFNIAGFRKGKAPPQSHRIGLRARRFL